TQSMTGADVTDGSNANVWTLNGYSGTQSFSELTDITTSGASITAGAGFLLYVFSDTDWDGDDDLPVTISVAGKLNNSSATFPSSGSIAASKFGLAGNPYNATIDFDLITLSNIEVTTSVWDDANSDWKTWNKTSQSGDLSNGLIAPYQGFWVQAISSTTGTITIETGDKSGTGTFYKITDDDNRGSISLKATTGNFVSESYLSFYSEGTTELDEGDSKKLLPFQASSRVVIMSVVDGQPLKINSFPYENIVTVTVPIDVMNITLSESNYVTEAGEVTLTWNMDQLPDHIGLILTDNITGAETYLDQESEYTFTTEPKGSFSATYDGPIGTYPVVGEPRFTLNVTYGALGKNEDATLPSDFALHPIYPNPFNPSASISFDVPDFGRVRLDVYDVKGALVETLLNETMRPGRHKYAWRPDELASGVYFLKLVAGAKAFTQKVTYIK
nr:T9SS type A sorting domain-containing protein [Dehalococcoidia bacterium]